MALISQNHEGKVNEISKNYEARVKELTDENMAFRDQRSQ